jgi:phosphatidylglycerophosphate synthase
MTRADFLLALGAFEDDPSRNISDGACASRGRGGARLITCVVLASLALKLRLFGLGRVLPATLAPHRKPVYYVLSVLLCAGVASVLEAELQVCLLVAALSESSRGTVVVVKAVAIGAIAFIVQAVSYYVLGMGERGDYLFCCRSCRAAGAGAAIKEGKADEGAPSRNDSCCRNSSALYLPNIIGYARLALIGIGSVSMWVAPAVDDAALVRTAEGSPGGIWGAAATIGASSGRVRFIVCWLMSCSLDFFDGYLARRLGQCSRLGEVLDVVCDNVARSAMWFAVASTRPELAPLAMVLTCLEWLTFAATQIMSADRHWKSEASRTPAHPPIVAEFFSENFVNPLGALGLAGMYGLPLFLFVEPAVTRWVDMTATPWAEEAFVLAIAYYFPVLLAKVSTAKVQEIVTEKFAFTAYILPLVCWTLYAGRLLSAGIECYFCQSFFERLANVQGQERKRKHGGEKES